MLVLDDPMGGCVRTKGAAIKPSVETATIPAAGRRSRAVVKAEPEGSINIESDGDGDQSKEDEEEPVKPKGRGGRVAAARSTTKKTAKAKATASTAKAAQAREEPFISPPKPPGELK
jgi:hypothetical protein